MVLSRRTMRWLMMGALSGTARRLSRAQAAVCADRPCDVGSVALHGVDYLRMTPDGLVTEFHVMVRPLGALTALERAVTERMRSAGTPPQ
jgi:hypothetical protein